MSHNQVKLSLFLFTQLRFGFDSHIYKREFLFGVIYMNTKEKDKGNIYQRERIID